VELVCRKDPKGKVIKAFARFLPVLGAKGKQKAEMAKDGVALVHGLIPP
jgi:hypothetical protein